MKAPLLILVFISTGLYAVAQDAITAPSEFLFKRNHITLSWYQGVDPGYSVSPNLGNSHASSTYSPVYYAQLAYLLNLNDRLAIRLFGLYGGHGFTLENRSFAEPQRDLIAYMKQYGLGTEILYRHLLTSRTHFYGGGGLSFRWTTGSSFHALSFNQFHIRLFEDRHVQPGIQGAVGFIWNLPWEHQISAEIRGRYALNQMFNGHYTYFQTPGSDQSSGLFDGNGHTIMLGLGYHFTRSRILSASDKYQYGDANWKDIRKQIRENRDWTRPDRALHLKSSLGLLKGNSLVNDPNGTFKDGYDNVFGFTLKAEANFERGPEWQYYVSIAKYVIYWTYRLNVPEGVPFSPFRFLIHLNEFTQVGIGAGRRLVLPNGIYLGEIQAGIGVNFQASHEILYQKQLEYNGTFDTLRFDITYSTPYKVAPVMQLGLSRDWRLYPRLSLVTAFHGRLGFLPYDRLTIDYQITGNNPVPATQALVDFRGTSAEFTLGLKYRIAGWNRDNQ